MRSFLKVVPVLLAFFAVGALYIAWDQPIAAETSVAPASSGSEVISVTSDSEILLAPARNTIASAATSADQSLFTDASIVWVLAFIWLATLTALLFQYREQYVRPATEL